MIKNTIAGFKQDWAETILPVLKATKELVAEKTAQVCTKGVEKGKEVLPQIKKQKEIIVAKATNKAIETYLKSFDKYKETNTPTKEEWKTYIAAKAWQLKNLKVIVGE